MKLSQHNDKHLFSLASGGLTLLEAALALLGAKALLTDTSAQSLAIAVCACAALLYTLSSHVRMSVRYASERGHESVVPDDATERSTSTSIVNMSERPDELSVAVAPALPTEESHQHAIQPAASSPHATAHSKRPEFDIDNFVERICSTSDPWAELRLFVSDIRTRETRGKEVPSPFERFAARILEEAGLLTTDLELPTVRIVHLTSSDLLYLRIIDRELPRLTKTRVLAIEAALNAICLSADYFDNPNAHSVEEHYQLLQRLTGSICAQSSNLADGIAPIDEKNPDTEWAVRLGISTALESLRLPQRLTASWRVNVADGNVAIELNMPHETCFPASAFVEDIGLINTTREMRRHAASAYALRLALLVAACAFRCSEHIAHVWVAGHMESPSRTWCCLSVDFDRPRFARLDLTELGDLAEVYHLFAAELRYEEKILRPVQQTFALDEFRFCPPRRYESVGLSSRRLYGEAVRALGTDHVSGLAINEDDKRRLIAGDIMIALGDSTERNVRTILELAGDDPDPSVRAAAERTVSKLIAGTLKDEPLAVGEEFAAGDELTRAVFEAQRYLHTADAETAARLLEDALARFDTVGSYSDSPSVEWRYFPSYVNRTMYNRLCATSERTLMLVPDAYFEAHLLLSISRLALGQGEAALAHAQRLVELSPLDTRARLHTARCLEVLGRTDEACEMLRQLLEHAHDPQTLGMGYYRMAFFQWQRGNILAAQACYQRALMFMPQATPVIAMELTALALQNPGSLHEELSDEDVETILDAADVPLAPTAEVSATFLDAARGALDAEIFPVARGFLSILGAFSGDDILLGVLRSIEDAPGQNR